MNETIAIGTTVIVPNGERGTIVDAYRKDGEDRLTVEFADGTTLTISPLDVRVA